MNTREAILAAGLEVFDEAGFDDATVAAVCRRADVSNGSFFHAFRSKDNLAGTLFLAALIDYHDAMLAVLQTTPAAAPGVEGLVTAHLDWVTGERRLARFIFEQSRSGWLVSLRDTQRAENTHFGAAIEAWRTPLLATGALVDLPADAFFAQLIGPAQVFCRAWLGGRAARDPREHREVLIECAVRALVAA